MKVIKPWVKYEKFDGIKIMKNLEKACRTCYRSEDKISEDSYKSLLKNCITRGHESILEHEKITVRLCCDVGTYKDLTRHRAGASFSIESTRYCNYSKDKYDNNIKFIEPVFSDDKEKYNIWKHAMEEIEKDYLKMSEIGAKPDELRMILPHSTAAEVVMSCNIREWKHILSLRCSKFTHSSIRQVLIPLLLLFKKEMPEIFDEIEYDKDFPKEKYASIEQMK